MNRVDQLAGRVRWLDRYRRLIAVIATLVTTPLLVFKFEQVVGNDWPDAHIWLTAIVLALSTWWVTEVALAGVAAVWETQADRLARSPGLPIARVVRR